MTTTTNKGTTIAEQRLRIQQLKNEIADLKDQLARCGQRVTMWHVRATYLERELEELKGEGDGAVCDEDGDVEVVILRRD
jgi:chromosome segregation ATPase